jgi:hypothetical protein
MHPAEASRPLTLADQSARDAQVAGENRLARPFPSRNSLISAGTSGRTGVRQNSSTRASSVYHQASCGESLGGLVERPILTY